MGRVGGRKNTREGEVDSRCSLSCLELKGKEGEEEKVDVCVVRRPQLLVRVCRRTLGR